MRLARTTATGSVDAIQYMMTGGPGMAAMPDRVPAMPPMPKERGRLRGP